MLRDDSCQMLTGHLHDLGVLMEKPTVADGEAADEFCVFDQS